MWFEGTIVLKSARNCCRGRGGVLHMTVDSYDVATPYLISIFIELHILVIINVHINLINKLTHAQHCHTEGKCAK